MKNNSTSFEKLFQSHLETEKTNIFRVMCLLGAFLYLVFAIVDYYLLSARLIDILLIRGFVIGTLLAVFVYSHHESFSKQYDFLFLAVSLLAAAGIEAIIYLTSPTLYTANVHLAGLILVIMTLFTWSYIKIWNSLLASAIIITSYAILGFFNSSFSLDLIVNITFLLSATVIGLISQLNRDRYIKDNFMLQQSLKDSVQEKTVEANQDALTGLANRRHVKILLAKSLELAKKKKDKTLVIMFIDLNGFKQINDTYGHSIGDKVLTITAKRLELAIRKNDIVSRLGGDEYLIGLLIKKKSISTIEQIAQKYLSVISAPMRIGDLKISINASIGVATYPRHGKTVNDLIDTADKKMYLIKFDDKEKTKISVAHHNSEGDFDKPILRVVK